HDAMIGSSELRTAEGPITVDSPFEFSTYFNFNTKIEKTFEIYGHQVTDEKVRQQFFGGFLPKDYRIYVDGDLVVERGGY
ncbi:MAG TPA: hypothetical protein VGI80_04190, partial [Pyrinomonadaceae bacterium]